MNDSQASPTHREAIMWATGFGYDSSGKLQLVLEHWDGTTWTRATLPAAASGDVSWSGIGVAASASGATTWAIVDQVRNHNSANRSQLILRNG